MLTSSSTGAFLAGISTDRGVLTTRARLRARPLWYNGLRCGQVFLDPHESTLEYHVVPHDPYHSFIESRGLRIDVDSTGSPVFVELDLRLIRPKVLDPLEMPRYSELCRQRFLDFPIQIAPPKVATNIDNSLYHIRFSRLAVAERWSFAPGGIWELDQGSCVVGLWLYDIIGDPSRSRRMAWRAGTWRAYRQGRTEELESFHSRPERGWLSPPKIFT
jgi:hypothetical protein